MFYDFCRNQYEGDGEKRILKLIVGKPEQRKFRLLTYV